MSYRRRIHCYVCDNAFQIQQMARINGDNNAIKRQIAISRRDGLEKVSSYREWKSTML